MYIYVNSYMKGSGFLTQVEYVDHGLQPQCVIQRHHRHGVSVAGQLCDDPL